MNIISKRRIDELSARHPSTTLALRGWYNITKKAAWKNLLAVHSDFADADQVGKLLVFNVRHNSYRLIVKVDFRSRLIKDLLTHDEYNKGGWKRWAL